METKNERKTETKLYALKEMAKRLTQISNCVQNKRSKLKQVMCWVAHVACNMWFFHSYFSTNSVQFSPIQSNVMIFRRKLLLSLGSIADGWAWAQQKHCNMLQMSDYDFPYECTIHKRLEQIVTKIPFKFRIATGVPEAFCNVVQWHCNALTYAPRNCLSAFTNKWRFLWLSRVNKHKTSLFTNHLPIDINFVWIKSIRRTLRARTVWRFVCVRHVAARVRLWFSLESVHLRCMHFVRFYFDNRVIALDQVLFGILLAVAAVNYVRTWLIFLHCLLFLNIINRN